MTTLSIQLTEIRICPRTANLGQLQGKFEKTGTI